MKEKTTGQGQWALRLVSSPPTTPSQGYVPATTYEYLDNRYRPYLITTVTNKPSAQPSTWSTTRWTYDVKKRVTSVESQGGFFRWQYAYDDAKQQVTITEPAGWKVPYDRKQGSNGLTALIPVGGVGTAPLKQIGPPRKSASSLEPPTITCLQNPLACAAYCTIFPDACKRPPAMCSTGYPPGYWPGDQGAKEWGRRYGVGADEGRRRFHDLKGKTPGSKPNDNYGVNPNTGDVIDPNGESVGNLEDR